MGGQLRSTTDEDAIPKRLDAAGPETGKKILHTRPFLSEKQKKNTGQTTLKI